MDLLELQISGSRRASRQSLLPDYPSSVRGSCCGATFILQVGSPDDLGARIRHGSYEQKAEGVVFRWQRIDLITNGPRSSLMERSSGSCRRRSAAGRLSLGLSRLYRWPACSEVVQQLGRQQQHHDPGPRCR